MESHPKDEVSLPPQVDDEDFDELPSPPRIQRLQNRRRKKNVGNDDHSDSDSGVYSMQFLPVASPPRSSSSTNCDIAEFRRRLDLVKERRARQSTSRSTPKSSEQSIDSPCVHCPTTHGIYNCNASTILEDTWLPSQQDASPAEKPKGFAPMNDSPVSTCQTFDDITLDTTMDSPKFMQHSPQEYRVGPLPPSTGRVDRKGGNCTGNDFLNLRRFMCSSSERNIDTSFAQITDAICRPKSAIDDSSSERQRKTKKAGKHDYLGAGEFPGNVAPRAASPNNIPANGLLDRLFCTRASSSPVPRRTQPKSSKHSSKENKYMDFGEFPSNDRTSPGRNRRPQKCPVGPGNNASLYNAMDPDEHIVRRQNEIDEFDRIQLIPTRSGSSFSSFFRKDPWYLRSSDSGEDGDELVVDDDSDTEVLVDRIMHAVVFVEKGEI